MLLLRLPILHSLLTGLFLLTITRTAATTTTNSLPSFYHTTDAILAEFHALATEAGSCPGAILTLTTTPSGNGLVPLTVATFAARKDSAASSSSPVATNRALVLFGEHARELISPETALRMAQDLCGKNSETKALAWEVLKTNVVTLIPIANPKGRTSVENGNYCQRVNENGVDLNRNWDSHWEPSESGYNKDTYSGTQPFSEPETQALKKIVDDLKPTIFITVHSGTLGMYTPYAFSTDLPTNDPTDLDRMKNILNALNPQYCKCPSGAAGLDVGYLCPGTCLDYAYEHHASISFAFEIYASDHDAIHAQWESDHAATLVELQHQLNGVLEKGENGAEQAENVEIQVRESAGTTDTSSYSCFLQSSTKAQHHHQHTIRQLSDDGCFNMFNPSDEQEYKETTSKWSEAFLKMLDMAAKSALVRDLGRLAGGGGDGGDGAVGAGGGSSTGASVVSSVLRSNIAQPAVGAVVHMLRMKGSRSVHDASTNLRGGGVGGGSGSNNSSSTKL